MAIPKNIPTSAPNSSFDMNNSNSDINMYSLVTGLSSQPSSGLEIRLFFVRVTPCVLDTVPDHLTLRHIRREIGVSLDINGSRVPASDTASLALHRDRVDKDSSEVTYVTTSSVRVTGSVDFEVYEGKDMVLCGSLLRVESGWGNASSAGSENDSRTGWTMDCYMAASLTGGASAFFQPKLGVCSPSIEVYIAGCCSGSPVILTKTIQVSPRRKPSRHGALDAIPEDEVLGKEHKSCNGLVHQPKGKLQITEAEQVDYELLDQKAEHDFYPEQAFINEDGQLTWFNAGVRVGVGIGLGMCLGIGIGVGLLMSSYQTATRNLRRRFW